MRFKAAWHVDEIPLGIEQRLLLDDVIQRFDIEGTPRAYVSDLRLGQHAGPNAYIKTVTIVVEEPFGYLEWHDDYWTLFPSDPPYIGPKLVS